MMMKQGKKNSGILWGAILVTGAIVGILAIWWDKLFGSRVVTPLLTTASTAPVVQPTIVYENASSDAGLSVQVADLQAKWQGEIIENLTVTTDGQTVFTYANMPKNYNINRLIMEINGQLRLTLQKGYTVNSSAKTITITGSSLGLLVGDTITLYYF